MSPIKPSVEDAEAIARLHVQAWAETYAGLLPASEIARAGFLRRLKQWQAVLQAATGRVAWVPGSGFASAGPQRDAVLAGAGYSGELYTIYVLQSAQGRGVGSALLRAVAPDQPFSALVLDGNDPACRFYERSGARLWAVRDDRIGDAAIRKRAYVWDAGLAATVL